MKLDMLKSLKNMIKNKKLDVRLPSLNAQYGVAKIDTGLCYLDNYKLVLP